MTDRRLMTGFLAIVLSCSAVVCGCRPASVEPMAFGEPRSACWRSAKAIYDSAHSECEACGRKGKDADLQTHHIVGFNKDKSLECVQSNLIRLCRVHHLWLGHCGDYRYLNPSVREDAKRFREMIANRVPNE